MTYTLKFEIQTQHVAKTAELNAIESVFSDKHVSAPHLCQILVIRGKFFDWYQYDSMVFGFNPA